MGFDLSFNDLKQIFISGKRIFGRENKVDVGWGFYPNKNKEIQKTANCHPELDSGSSHRQEYSANCPQKTNVGLKAQPT